MNNDNLDVPEGFQDFSILKKFLWMIKALTWVVLQGFGELIKLWGVKFSLLLGSLAICIVVVELGFRVAGYIYDVDYRLYFKELTNSDRLPQGFIAEDTDLKIKLIPYAQVLAQTSDFSVIYNVNSKGLRDDEYDYTKPAGMTRILAFGDSFTFGEGVPTGERFTEVIEDNMRDVEVLNFGIPGFGIDQSLLYYYLEGQKYDADVVVLFANLLDAKRARLGLTLSGEVDLSRIQPETLNYDVDTIYLKKDDLLYQQKVPIWLQPFYSYAYMRYYWTVWNLQQSMEISDKTAWDSHAKLKLDDLDDDYDILKQRTGMLLEKFSKLAEENQQTFILVNIDLPQDVNYFENVNNKINIIDLSNDLARLSQETPLTFKYDLHYNPETHKFIGEKTALYLQSFSELK